MTFKIYVDTECFLKRTKIKEGEDKERDHCHITGKFRGAANKKCNVI